MKKLLFAFLLLSSLGFAQTTCVNCGGISALSDNGTNVISTEQFLAPDAGFAFTGNTALSVARSSNTMLLGGSNLAISSALHSVTVRSDGGFAFSSNTNPDAGFSDTAIRRRSAANFALGLADLNGAPAAQTISVQNAITGTDLAGSTFTIDAPLGTGAGAGASTKINRAQILATGTTSQTGANAFVVCETKILSNTSATTTTIATVGLASNSGGGATVFHSLTATDATNFDSETQSYNVSFVNKAGVITVGTPAITTSTAANNSGSATIGATVTGASPTISLKVTPVYGTIVPTTVTLYTTIINHGAGAVTCQ